MWNGGPPNHHYTMADSSSGTDPSQLALAASALAAYSTAVPQTGEPSPYMAYPPEVIYQAQAMEALRRQEEIRRRQAYLSMHVQQQQQAYVAPKHRPDDHHHLSQDHHHPQDHHHHHHLPNHHHPQDHHHLPHPQDHHRRLHHHVSEESRPRHSFSPIVASKELRASQDSASSSEFEEEAQDDERDHSDSPAIDGDAIPVAPAPPEADEEAEAFIVEDSSATKSKKQTPKKIKPVTKTQKKPSSTSSGLSIEDPYPEITNEDYENVEKLMMQFCRVPLLAEFSRPVSLLHPELMSVYSKIVKRPIDLGRVCRRIRRRTYRDTRSIRMDMWRIFSNCIKYHTHPGNKENAVPAFISISLHLRSYFNALWQEYMLPSEFPGTLNGKQPRGSAVAIYREALDKRDTDRIQRLHGTGSTLLSKKCIEKLKLSIHEFVRAGGCVDVIDKEPVFGMDDQDDEEGDLQAFLDNISQYQKRLEDVILNDTEYSVDEMVRDIKRCYSTDLFENRPSFRACIASRLDRLVGKMVVPIYETSCRGVNQSSIWGCMAAAIWARESSKKPYWPALVLGIMAPDCQREAWHAELTARNESRLPEKLLNELQVGKRKAEQSLKRDTKLGPQQLSYFLVEFMGTHEFIWVKEGDIIETFDPEEDPNLASGVGNVTKKKRSFRSIAESKTFQAAIEEGRWALEEFEMQLSDACGDHGDDDDADEEQEMNYSYNILSQSDDEADDEEEDMYDETNLTASDIEEANEMLASDGMIDYSIEGRKNARKRSLARKKEKVNAEKAAAKKEKTDHSKKSKDKKVKVHKEVYDKISNESPKEDLRDGIELPMKRKIEKDPVLKSKKKQKTDCRIDPVSKLTSKRGRATAIINGYLTRLLKKEEMKNLCLAGVLSMPASVVDAQGLLGMALAFRAAAGEIPVPDDADYKFKPWKQIDAESPVTSAERIKKLEKQLSIIRHKVEDVKASTSKRKRLTEIAIDKKHRFEEDILALEIAAKKDIMSRTLKKKPVFRGDLKACGDSKPPISTDTNGEVAEVVVQGGYDDGDAAKAVEEPQATVYEEEDDDDDDESD